MHVLLLAVLFLVPSIGQAQEIRGSMEPLAGADDDFSPYALGPAPDTAFTDGDIGTEDLRTDPADPVPPALAETEDLRPRKREPDDSPYDQLGIRAGGFLLKPSIETFGGYESNPTSVEDQGGSYYSRTEGRLDVESDWVRHEFRGRLEAEYTAYEAFPDLDAPRFSGDAALRVDARRDLRLDFAVRSELDSQSPGDPELPDGVKGRPQNLRTGASAGAIYKPNRLSIGLRGDFDRRTYEDAELNNGGIVDNEDRNYNSYTAELRTGYELGEGLEPFVEIEGNERDYDVDTNDNGLLQNTRSIKAYAGARVEPSPLWAFEGAIGYGHIEAEDPFAPELDDFIAKASLIWQPSVLTKVTLTAAKDVAPATLDCCVVAREISAGLEIEHQFRRHLIATAGLQFERTDYPGADYTLQDVDAEIALEYKFNRSVSAKIRAAHQISDSSNDDDDYDTSLIEVGVRVQR